jgi:hypothetical protein
MPAGSQERIYFFVRLLCVAYATTKTTMKMAAMAPGMDWLPLVDG